MVQEFQQINIKRMKKQIETNKLETDLNCTVKLHWWLPLYKGNMPIVAVSFVSLEQEICVVGPVFKGHLSKVAIFKVLFE